MAFDCGGRKFETMLCSDNEPDSMYLEISEIVDGKSKPVLEIRYIEEDGTMTFTAFKRDLPYELMEYYGRSARQTLTPIDQAAE